MQQGGRNAAVREVEGCGEEGRGYEEEHVLQEPGVEGAGGGVGEGTVEVAEDLAWRMKY